MGEVGSVVKIGKVKQVLLGIWGIFWSAAGVLILLLIALVITAIVSDGRRTRNQ